MHACVVAHAACAAVKKQGGKGYVPSFMPPGMAAAMAGEKAGDKPAAEPKEEASGLTWIGGVGVGVGLVAAIWRQAAQVSSLKHMVGWVAQSTR